MKILVNCILLFLLPLYGFSQSFVNGDLEGTPTTQVSTMAPGWLAVPHTDPACMANTVGTATPDLTSLIGPSLSGGLAGAPYSGATFMSGGLGTSSSFPIFHEGIMQTVSGFTPDSSYVIGFMQSVLISFNNRDKSGSWAVYADTTLLGIVQSSFSNLHYQDLNLIWENRSVVFTATDTVHTIKFLPADDDLNFVSSTTDTTGALRMAIDSIYLMPLHCSLAVNLGNDTSICQGQQVTLTATSTFANYSWSNGSVAPTISVSQPGTYWVEVSSNGCTAKDSITITLKPLPDFSLGNDTSLCAGDSLQLQVSVPGGSYLWQNGTSDSVFTATQTGIYWVRAIVLGCSATDSVEVVFHALPVVDFGADTTLCTGEKLILFANNSGADFLWNNGSALPELEVAEPGNYWLTVTRNGCSASDTIAVAFTPAPQVSLGNDTSVCAGTELLLRAISSAPALTWSDNSTAQEISVTESGTYWVKAVDNGCSNSDTVSVEFKPMPFVSLGADSALCQGDVLLLNAEYPGATFIWQNGSTGSSFAANSEGHYWVEANLNGCKSKSEIHLAFTDCNSSLVIPNIFTPNNDGVNDLFEPKSTNAIVKMHTVIFNRWGKQIFETNSLQIGWDGTSAGDPVPEGTYYYRITYEGLRTAQQELKGWVTIVR